MTKRETTDAQSKTAETDGSQVMSGGSFGSLERCDWTCPHCGHHRPDTSLHQCPTLVDQRIADLEALLATANEKARYCTDETAQALVERDNLNDMKPIAIAALRQCVETRVFSTELEAALKAWWKQRGGL